MTLYVFRLAPDSTSLDDAEVSRNQGSCRSARVARGGPGPGGGYSSSAVNAST